MRGVAMVSSSRRDILWLDDRYGMNYSDWNNISGAWPPNPNDGVFEPLSGTFASAPVGVALGPNRLDVFGLGVDYAVYHRVYHSDARDGVHWSPDWESLGGNLSCTPVVLSVDNEHIDLFGLTNDQSMVHRSSDGATWSPWEVLGGAFTSAPVVLPHGDGSFDIFGRGLDFLTYHANYRPGQLPDWSLLGGGLLGEPVASSAPAAIRVHDKVFVFVISDDGGMRSIEFDGTVWRPWQALLPPAKDANGTPIPFIGEPTLAAFFPSAGDVFEGGSGGLVATGDGGSPWDSQPPSPMPRMFRLDVFGVGSDARLFHRWMDSHGWHGAIVNGNETPDWEVLPLSLSCPPSAVYFNRGHTPFAMPPISISLVGACTDGVVRVLALQNGVWTSWPYGPRFTLPCCYKFSVDAVQIDNTRALHNDTNYAVAHFNVGRSPARSATSEMGDVGTGGYELFNLQFDGQVVELCEPAIFSYSIVNSGNSDIAKAVVGGILKAAGDFAANQLKSIINPPVTAPVLSALDDDVARLSVPPQEVPLTLTDVTSVALGATLGPPFVGGIFAALIAAGIEGIVGIAFADCDGVVASKALVFPSGRRIHELAWHAPNHQIAGQTQNLGTDTPGGCGGNSSYTVFWTVAPAQFGI